MTVLLMLTPIAGMHTAYVPIAGIDNSVRLLKREGVIDMIPKSLCEQYRGTPAKHGKNGILVIG